MSTAAQPENFPALFGNSRIITSKPPFPSKAVTTTIGRVASLIIEGLKVHVPADEAKRGVRRGSFRTTMLVSLVPGLQDLKPHLPIRAVSYQIRGDFTSKPPGARALIVGHVGNSRFQLSAGARPDPVLGRAVGIFGVWSFPGLAVRRVEQPVPLFRLPIRIDVIVESTSLTDAAEAVIDSLDLEILQTR